MIIVKEFKISPVEIDDFNLDELSDYYEYMCIEAEKNKQIEMQTKNRKG